MDYELGKLIQGLSYPEYDAISAVRSGMLQSIRRSPAHFQWEQKHPKEPSKAMLGGLNLHSALERPQEFKDSLIEIPQFVGKTKDGRDSERSAEAKEKKAEWFANLPPGKLALTKEEIEKITEQLNMCLQHRLLGNMVREGQRESTVVVKDPDTGLLLKCKYDFISKQGWPVDFKSTRDARPSYFLQTIYSERSYFYVLNAAHYAYCAKISGQCESKAFIFVAVENVGPYGIRIYTLDEHELDVGERERARLTRLYAECLAKNSWPSYPEKAIRAVIPGWVQYHDEEEDL